MSTTITVKRVYDQPARSDGRRILVDRLWPRGVAKAAAGLDDWKKDIAPPRELLAWFHDDKQKRFKSFEKKYASYLKEQQNLLKEITDAKGTVTLVTAVKDIEHSHIPTLLRFINDSNKKVRGK